MEADELAKRSFDAWNRDDVEAWLPSLSPDVVYHVSGIFPGLEPVYLGHDGIRAFWRAMHEPWEELRLEFEQLVPLDECHAVADFRFHAVGAGSGAAVELTFSNGVRIEDGLIAELFAARTREEAAERMRAA